MVETARNLIQEHFYPAVLAIILVCVVFASCTNGDAGSDLETPFPATVRSTVAIGTATIVFEAPSPTSFMRPTSISGPTVTTIPEPVSAAIARAAMDREVSPSDVVVLRFLEESWPSTALGCPEEGRSYAQIVTTGYAVAFSIVGELAFYHVDLTGAQIVVKETTLDSDSDGSIRNSDAYYRVVLERIPPRAEESFHLTAVRPSV